MYYKKIVFPSSKEHKGISVVYSGNEDLRNELQTSLLQNAFSVLPLSDFPNLLDALSEMKINVLIFDVINNYSEIFSFLRSYEHIQKVPMLFVGSIDHILMNKLQRLPVKYSELKLPLTDTELNGKLSNLLQLTDGNFHQSVLLSFLNTTISELNSLIPRDDKTLIINAINYALDENLQRSSVLKRGSKRSYDIIFSGSAVGDSYFEDSAIQIIKSLINNINSVYENTMGNSIVSDALFQALYKQNEKSQQNLIELLKRIGVSDVSSYKMSLFKSENYTNRQTQTAFIALEDDGPTLRLQTKTVFGEIFDGLTVGQLLSLVGQGEQYHEGLFGPLPVTTDSKLMCVIYSQKLIDKSIKDERLRGYTLSVICVAFPKSVINNLPSRGVLNSLFSPFSELTDIVEVNDSLLNDINESFQKLIFNQTDP